MRHQIRSRANTPAFFCLKKTAIYAAHNKDEKNLIFLSPILIKYVAMQTSTKGCKHGYIK